MMIVAAGMALVIGALVTRRSGFSPRQSYTALLVVVPLGLLAGIPANEVLIDCAGLGIGVALARRDS